MADIYSTRPEFMEPLRIRSPRSSSTSPSNSPSLIAHTKPSPMTPLTEDDLEFIKNRSQAVDPIFAQQIYLCCVSELEELTSHLWMYSGTDLEAHFLSLAKKMRKEKRLWEIICELQDQELELLREADFIEEALGPAEE